MLCLNFSPSLLLKREGGANVPLLTREGLQGEFNYFTSIIFLTSLYAPATGRVYLQLICEIMASSLFAIGQNMYFINVNLPG